MFELLKNKYFFNEKSPSYILIPEKEGKSPSFTRILEKISTFLKENPLNMSEFLKKRTF
jgi:hypothetical protein